MNYAVEARYGEEWSLVGEVAEYNDVFRMTDGWTEAGIVYRVRRGNELIYTNYYGVRVRPDADLTIWRKKHIGEGSPDPSREAGA